MKTHQIIVLAFLCIVVNPCFGANLVTNPGFENSENTSGGRPTTYGNWQGDYSQIANASSGIIPLSGSQMLWFKGTSFGGSSGGDTSEVHQLINVSQYSPSIASGQAVAIASAYFNRVAGGASTDNFFFLNVIACNGSPSQFPTVFADRTQLSWTDCIVYTDSNPDTWELATLSVTLPVGTTYLAIGVNANENISNNSGSAEFDGHFADAVSLEIIPEPATISMLILGGIAIFKKQ